MTPITDRVLLEFQAGYIAQDMDRLGLHGASRCRYVLHFLRESKESLTKDPDAIAVNEAAWTEVAQSYAAAIRLVEREMQSLGGHG